MTLLDFIRRNARRLLPVLAAALALSANGVLSGESLAAGSHNHASSGHLMHTAMDAVPAMDCHDSQDREPQRVDSECCQHACQCPIASGAALSMPMQANAALPAIEGEMEFPPIRLLATQWRPELHRPPI